MAALECRFLQTHLIGTATEDFREDVARCGDALTGGASDAYGEGPPHNTLLPGIGPRNVAFQLLNGLRLAGDNPLHQVAN